MIRTIRLVIAWRSVAILRARCPYCGERGGIRLPNEDVSPHVATGHPL